MAEQTKQNREGLTSSEKEQEIKKSRVRVRVTYIAASFLFGVSTGLIIWFMLGDGDTDKDRALTVFNTILPVAAGIVTYWFATRSNQKSKNDDTNDD